MFANNNFPVHGQQNEGQPKFPHKMNNNAGGQSESNRGSPYGYASRGGGKKSKPRTGSVLKLSTFDWQGYFDEQELRDKLPDIGENQNVANEKDMQSNPAKNAEELNPSWGDSAFVKPSFSNREQQPSHAAFNPRDFGQKPRNGFAQENQMGVLENKRARYTEDATFQKTPPKLEYGQFNPILNAPKNFEPAKVQAQDDFDLNPSWS
ncbi:hypothetical protein Ddc_01998 [Ditylenchus destructor]|nr:hypothetical protein Ddc_01998 [Ditylenchus destructor]